MLIISAPKGVNPRVWNELNAGIKMIGPEQLSEFIKGVQESITSSKIILEMNNPELRDALNIQADAAGLTTHEIRKALKINIRTSEEWVRIYSKQIQK